MLSTVGGDECWHLEAPLGVEPRGNASAGLEVEEPIYQCRTQPNRNYATHRVPAIAPPGKSTLWIFT